MVSDVYVTMMRANAHLGKMASMPWGGTGSAWHHAYLNANRDIKLVYGLADSAQVALLDHLGHERTEA
jgi:hypothetical protein